MRDLRDPQKLGEKLLYLRKKGIDWATAVNWPSPNYSSNESCIEKYGRADEVEPAYAEIRVR